MTQEEKLEVLMDIVEQIAEVYPKMNKVLMNDVSEPDYLIISTSEYLKKFESAMGMEEGSSQEFYEATPAKKDTKIQ